MAAIIEDIRLWTGQLNATLHQHHYRILEADDLEQAELLARIWQPHTVLLMPTACQETDVTCEKSVGEGLRRLSQQSTLASIPLIATDPQTVQCLHNLPQEDLEAPLQVLPCLAANRTVAGTRLPDPQTLLQVIQVAAGVASQPSVLIVDIAHLPDLSYGQVEGSATAAQGMEADVMDRSPWLKALVQYMDKAGFRSVMGNLGRRSGDRFSCTASIWCCCGCGTIA
ncbi:MAG: hypothetical protein HC925_09500 [Coleofasciculaceae cyanobacterium SM2_3_26]|nr:hypothetical protein [Coleofasciculaceae cyanobacterium SM2_3_26]